jgi:hypothetical protein
MRPPTAAAVRIILVGGLTTGWLVGLLGQRSIVEETGYLDISPQLMLLGIVLCALAGAVTRVLATRHQRVRFGALGGIAMMVSMVGGYLLLVLAYADRFNPDESGETWFSLLLEAWFWIGVPVVASAVLGSIGWLAADALGRVTRRSARSR